MNDYVCQNQLKTQHTLYCNKLQKISSLTVLIRKDGNTVTQSESLNHSGRIIGEKLIEKLERQFSSFLFPLAFATASTYNFARSYLSRLNFYPVQISRRHAQKSNVNYVTPTSSSYYIYIDLSTYASVAFPLNFSIPCNTERTFITEIRFSIYSISKTADAIVFLGNISDQKLGIENPLFLLTLRQVVSMTNIEKYAAPDSEKTSIKM